MIQSGPTGRRLGRIRDRNADAPEWAAGERTQGIRMTRTHAKERAMSTYKFAPLPSMPSKGKANRPTHDCACGCGQGTKSTWYPGHDGRATGWAVRIEKGILSVEDVPANERRGAEIMLKRREGASMAEAIATTAATVKAAERKLSKAERKAARRAAQELAKLTQATEPNVSDAIDTDLTDAEEVAS